MIVCGISRNDRADFPRRVVTYANDVVEVDAGPYESVPGLRTQFSKIIAFDLKEHECARVHVSFGLASGAVGFEFSRAKSIEDSFGHDGSCGISRTYKQDVDCHAANPSFRHPIATLSVPSGAGF